MLASNEIIMPVLGMIQDSGKIVRWLIAEGQAVKKGEPLLEVETDKAVAEIEAPVSGILGKVSAHEGEDVAVGTVIAVILPYDQPESQPGAAAQPSAQAEQAQPAGLDVPAPKASPIATRIAAEYNLDLALVRADGGRVEKAHVLAYLEGQKKAGRQPASPKARRLAAERMLDLAVMKGSGPYGAVLAADVEAASSQSFAMEAVPTPPEPGVVSPSRLPLAETIAPETTAPFSEISPGSIWRIMSERTAAAWREAPHFFLMREVEATRLIAWREIAQDGVEVKVTYTDLLVKLAAAALRKHPRLNARFQNGKIQLLHEINIGIATAVEDGLVVPVIHAADQLSITEIASARAELVERARAGRLRPEEISGGTFTISNLGMYGVDAFLAVLNTPQAAILAVGRIAEQVVAVAGQPAVRPMMNLSLSFDHRAVDGARGAMFLDTLRRSIEEPLTLFS
ncbi:MAG TPA: dihydrolipoamide acetyltransferase family protein [Armatimonadota bacterium]|nr:dihydrolipoamide acetyltransferase family protein [Armatimonadota bacterium]